MNSKYLKFWAAGRPAEVCAARYDADRAPGLAAVGLAQLPAGYRSVTPGPLPTYKAFG